MLRNRMGDLLSARIWTRLRTGEFAEAGFVVTATVQSEQVSVWAYAHPSAYWIRFNQVFWDDASLTTIDQP